MCGFCFDIKKCEICEKIFITQHTAKKDHIFCSQNCSRQYASSKMLDWYNEDNRRMSITAKKNHEINDKIKFILAVINKIDLRFNKK